MDKEVPFNALVSSSLSISEGVVVRRIVEAGVPYVQTVLVIDHYTNYDSISINRKIIKEFAKSLEPQFGTDLSFKYREHLLALLQWNNKRISPKKLTMILNYLGFALIYGAYQEKTNVPEHGKISEEFQEKISEPSFIVSLGGYGLITIFFALGMNIDDFNVWMKLGYESLADDQLRFQITNALFEEWRVRGSLRYFKECLSTGKITISENDSQWNELEHTIYIANLQGYFTKIDILLDKNGSEDWNRNKSFLQNWRARICKKWDDSHDPKIMRFRKLYKGM
jgi:hypothetical protein